MATRRSSRRRRTIVVRPLRQFTINGILIADGSIAVGTTRLTDLGSSWESASGEDLTGRLITNVRGIGSHIGTVGGIQTYTYALFVGSVSLDVADVFPASAPGNHPWWVRRDMVHRGQQHNVTSAVSEFTEHRLRFDTRGTRRMPGGTANMTLWFAEETLGQAQNAAWRFDIRTGE